jgi:hypothetical protein
MQLRIGEEYLRQFGKLAKESTTLKWSCPASVDGLSS